MARNINAINNPSYKHGHAMRGKPRPNIYRRWQHMIQRCHNPNDVDYAKYGGKGITVCDRWRNSFSDFLADMGMPSDPTLTLDRRDNTKGYSPDNCRWASPAMQNNNKSNTIFLTIRGNTMPLSAWCKLVGINSKTVMWRLKHMHMSHEAAVYTPLAWTKKK